MELFGSSPEDFGIDLIVEWIQYRQYWIDQTRVDPEWNKRISNYHFWNANKSRWSRLVVHAKWWINFKTSSVAAERTFALVRIMDSPQRGRLSWTTFSEQLQLKVNKEILAELLLDHVNEIHQMTKQ
jgi:hypothetical protein